MRLKLAKSKSDDQGFILVLTLLMLGIVSSVIVAILITGRTGQNEAAAFEAEAGWRAVVEAGAARATYSLRVPNDPLNVFNSLSVEPTVWRFEGIDVELLGELESGKIDLNAGHEALITAMLRTADLDSVVMSRFEASVTAARMAGRLLPSVRSLVAPCRRLSHEAAELERRFTVMTGLRGVTPNRLSNAQLSLVPAINEHDKQLISNALDASRSPLDDQRLTRLRPFLSDGTPVYSLVSRLRSRTDGALLAERRSVLKSEIGASYPRLVTVAWRIAFFESPCSN